MVALRSATFWLALLVPAMRAAARPGAGEERPVAALTLEVRATPEDTAPVTGTLSRGDRVVLLGEQHGWARIQAPADAFEWVDAATVRVGPAGTGTVVTPRSRARAGVPGARLPGPAGRTLARGAVVAFIDRPALRVGTDDDDRARTWRAVRVDPASVRYVAAAGLEPDAADPEPEAVDEGSTLPPTLPAPRAERLAAYRPEPPAEPTDEPTDPNLPAAVNAELASIAVAERSARAGEPESWALAPVVARYEALLRQFGDQPAVRTVVDRRLGHTRRDAAVAAKARAFADLLQKSHRRDAAVARIERSAAVARAQTDRQYDAQGLLQPSSRQYRGQKVLALIGPEGRPTSYLTLPPGVPVSRYLSRRVGVRGAVHFDEALGIRLIAVKDLELIDRIR